MTLHALPPNPAACTTLSDVDALRINRSGQTNWANPHQTCPNCLKTGRFKSRDDSGQIVEFECRCVEQWKMHRWMLNAGIGMRYQRLSWIDATGVNATSMAAVLAYVDNAERNLASGRGLTLGSPHKGTGKTLLATLLLKTLLAGGTDGYFTQFNDMLDAFSAGWRNEEERHWFQRRVRNAGVLVVDDIGREHKGRSEVAEAMFDTVIRARVSAAAPTIITTNYTLEQMYEGYGGNVLSLLSEVNTYIDFPGVDFRPKAQDRTVQDDIDGIVRPITVG